MSEEKKPGPLAGLTPEQRLDRYATLFRWQTEDEIDIQKLIDQWDADKMGVMAMMNQARRNPKLYDELRSLGYGDDEFPDWWYSPARSTEMKTDEPKMKKDDPPIKQEQPGTKTMDKDVLTPPDPKTPVSTLPIERVSSRPRLPDPIPSDRDPSEVIVPDPSTSGDGLTRSEIDLLGSRGIVRGQDGVWVHIVRARPHPLEGSFHETLSVDARASEYCVSRARFALRSVQHQLQFSEV